MNFSITYFNQCTSLIGILRILYLLALFSYLKRNSKRINEFHLYSGIIIIFECHILSGVGHYEPPNYFAFFYLPCILRKQSRVFPVTFSTVFYLLVCHHPKLEKTVYLPCYLTYIKKYCGEVKDSWLSQGYLCQNKSRRFGYNSD